MNWLIAYHCQSFMRRERKLFLQRESLVYFGVRGRKKETSSHQSRVLTWPGASLSLRPRTTPPPCPCSTWCGCSREGAAPVALCAQACRRCKRLCSARCTTHRAWSRLWISACALPTLCTLPRSTWCCRRPWSPICACRRCNPRRPGGRHRGRSAPGCRARSVAQGSARRWSGLGSGTATEKLYSDPAPLSLHRKEREEAMYLQAHYWLLNDPFGVEHMF